MPQVEIQVKGHIGESWSEWLDGLAISHLASGDTLLTGPITDQAALYGLVGKLRDIGLPLLSIHLLGNNELTLSPAASDPGPANEGRTS